MWDIRIVPITILLLSSLAIFLEYEAFAIEIPNMTQTEPPRAFTGIQNVSSPAIPRPVEQFAMSAQFVPHESQGLAEDGWYRMMAFGLNVSPNSQLCPANNCRFGFEDGELIPNTFTGGYVLQGRLTVATQQAAGISSEIYNVRGELNRIETLEQPNNITSFLTGELKVGTGTGSFGGDFDYRILNGSLAFTSGGGVLVLQGERSPTSGVQQQSSNMTTLQQQQPIIGQLPTSQQQQLQQLPSTMQQQVPLTQPFVQQPSSQQFQTQQPFIQTPQQPSTLVQPGAATTAGTTTQPQVSALPPSATTFPPSIYPPVSSLQPYGSNTGFYPSTTSGVPYGTSAGMPFSTTGITSVGASQQIVSPWFPSLPAISCGGTFALTVEGIPRGSDDTDNRITPSDKDDDDDHDDDKKSNGKSNRRLALQINSDNSQIFTDEDAIYGQIFRGQKNIDQNKANDFDIKSVFNDCQIVTYSS